MSSPKRFLSSSSQSIFHLHAGTDSDEQPDVDEAGDGDTDETIIEPKEIELVTLQVSCSTSKAMTH